MKITREDFKELVEVYKYVCDSVEEYVVEADDSQNFPVEELDKKWDEVEDLALLLLNWIGVKIGVADDEESNPWNILKDYYIDRKVPINFKIDKEGCFISNEYTNDLDVIYDNYVADKCGGDTTSITREDFKELVEICNETYIKIDKAKDDEVLELAMISHRWLYDKLGIRYRDFILDYCYDGKAPIAWREDMFGKQYGILFSDDLDMIYDIHIKHITNIAYKGE